MNIAIFIYERGFTSYYFNLIIGFANKNDTVSVFTHDAYEKYYSLRNLKHKNINIFKIYDSSTLINRLNKNIIRIIKNYINSNFRININAPIIISEKTLNSSARIIKNLSKFDLAIGCEKKGLIWAGTLFRNTRTKLFYYSLELYDDHHYSFINDISFSKLREQEIKYHKTCDATIIQDQQRCDYLYKVNSINQQPSLFLPVSISQKINLVEDNYLYNKFQIKQKKILLYFGSINDERKSYDIAKTFLTMRNDDFILIFNGYGEENYLKEILNISNNKIYVSKALEMHIDSLINDAYIGLVTYEYRSINDKLTVYSSEKLAYYLKHSKPFIAFHNEQYHEFIENYKCGVLIKNLSEFELAVAQIQTNYILYQAETKRAFEDIYCFENRFNVLHKEITSMVK